MYGVGDGREKIFRLGLVDPVIPFLLRPVPRE